MFRGGTMYSIHTINGQYYIYKYGEPYVSCYNKEIATRIVELLKFDYDLKYGKKEDVV